MSLSKQIIVVRPEKPSPWGITIHVVKIYTAKKRKRDGRYIWKLVKEAGWDQSEVRAAEQAQRLSEQTGIALYGGYEPKDIKQNAEVGFSDLELLSLAAQENG